MKRILTVIAMLIISAGSIFAQYVEFPGESSIGFGYDIFGEYASNTSVLERVFDLSGDRENRLGFSIPGIVGVTNLGMQKDYTVTEGNSLRKYAYDLSATVSLGVDAICFNASVESRFGKSSSQSVNNYFYTISDITQSYRVYIKEAKLREGRTYLTADARDAIDNWPVNDLISTYGTHVVVDALLGGRMEMNLTQSFSNREEAKSVGATVSASYSVVTASAGMDYSQSNVSSEMKKNITIQARGGSAQFINKSIIESGDNDQYNRWVETIGEKPTLVDFDENSLMPIWELAQPGSARQNEIKTVILRLIEQRQSEIPEGMGHILMMANGVYYVQSQTNNLYWDLPGYHLNAQSLNGRLGLYGKEGGQTGLQGADRFIKVIPNARDTQYVYLQPQHSDCVVTASGASAPPVLGKWDQNQNLQQFKMLSVDGSEGVFRLVNRANGLYITSTGNGITMEAELKGEDKNRQQWNFEEADGTTEMAPPTTDFIYAVKNVEARRFVDVPGAAPNQRGKDTRLNLWDFNSEPDHYVTLTATRSNSSAFYISPRNSMLTWDIEGGKNRADAGSYLQLWDSNQTVNQQFQFVYAGSPLTYYIERADNQQVLTAKKGDIERNGCEITMERNDHGANQQWKLYPVFRYQTVPVNQNFLIKSAYTNTYWDLPGTGNETNANGRPFQMWREENNYGPDRIFRFLDSGDAAWRLIEVQNGHRLVNVRGQSSNPGSRLELWDRVNGAAGEKFAIDITSHNTFALISGLSWSRAVDIAGGTSDDWKRSSQDLSIYNLHLGPNQHFRLIYADGPHKGKIYDFFNYREFK